ncbi:MAG: glucose 1-dehydrogenase [Pseudomonadota bacterium]
MTPNASYTDLAGKVAVVTGSARGIGQATAQLFAKQGAKVVVSDILDDLGHAAVSALRDDGVEATYISCNVSDEAAVAQLMSETIRAFGQIDCLVNNAGTEGQIAATSDYETAQFDRLVAVNLRGMWLCIKHAVPHMLSQGSGAIVNLASLAGHVGFAGLGPYVMSKHGVIGLTKVVAIEYSKHGIRTNAVSPGCIQTDMIDKLGEALGAKSAADALAHLHPLGRFGSVEEVAQAIVWLCSKQASNITGTSLSVDGGFIAQ